MSGSVLRCSAVRRYSEDPGRRDLIEIYSVQNILTKRQKPDIIITSQFQKCIKKRESREQRNCAYRRFNINTL